MKTRFLIAAVVIAMLAAPITSAAAASDITGAAFYSRVRATNSGNASASSVSAVWTNNTTAWIAAGLLNAQANNVAVLNNTGADTAFMPGYGSNPWVIWYDSIPTSTGIDATVYTPATGGKIRYFPGLQGANVTDHASLEPSGNFSVTYDGYLDTTAGSGKYLVQKSNALEVFVSPTVSGNITASIYPTSGSTANLTMIPDGAGDLTDMPLLVGAATQWQAVLTNDGDTSYIANNVAPPKTSLFTISDMPILPGAIQNVIVYAVLKNNGADATANITIKSAGTVYYQSAITETASYATYSATYSTDPATGSSWNATAVQGLQIGISGTPVAGTAFITQMYAIVNYYVVSVSATGVSSGEHEVALLYPYGSSGNLTYTSANGTAWSNLANAQDSNWSTYANDSIVGAGTWGGFTDFNYSGNSSGIRMSANNNGGSIGDVDVDYWNGSSWADVFEGAFSNNYNNSSDIYDDFIISYTQPVQAITKYRVRFYHIGGGATVILFEFRPIQYPTLKLAVDSADYHYAISPLSGFSVPDNSNPIVFAQNNVSPYVTSIDWRVGGNQTGFWKWEYAATFTDQSGNGNTMTPSFRTASSSSGVSTSMVAFSPVEISRLTGSSVTTWGEMITDAPASPSSQYTEDSRPGIFFEPIVHVLWGLTGLPDSIFWYAWAFSIIIGAGVLTYFLFAKNNKEAIVIKVIVKGALLIFFAIPGLNIFGMYVFLYYALYSFGTIVLSRSFGW